MTRKTTLAFVDAINRHDVERIVALMHRDHTFIDAYGQEENREQMRRGWPGYFAWFPDYRIEVGTLMAEGDTAGIFGFAGGTYRGNGTGWRLPAAWRVEVAEGKIRLWQVFCDSKIPYEAMEGAEG